ncbi:hypothetical protein VTK26DRAFT_4282 [Humicola hyalothermophila]
MPCDSAFLRPHRARHHHTELYMLRVHSLSKMPPQPILSHSKLPSALLSCPPLPFPTILLSLAFSLPLNSWLGSQLYTHQQVNNSSLLSARECLLDTHPLHTHKHCTSPHSEDKTIGMGRTKERTLCLAVVSYFPDSTFPPSFPVRCYRHTKWEVI